MVVLRVEDGDVSIHSRHRDQGKQAGIVQDVQLLGGCHLLDDRIVASRAGKKPEAGDMGLLDRAFGAVEGTHYADLIEVARPSLGSERGWWRGSELRAALHDPRAPAAHRGAGDDGGWHINARLRHVPIAFTRAAAVIR